MRTTLEIPDALFRRAKLVALERQTTLKALVASGLEKELGIAQAAPFQRLTHPPVQLAANSPMFESPLINDSDTEETEAHDLNEVYRRR